MLTNINMDIAAFKKNIDLRLENRRKKLEIRKKIQDYKDVKQGLAIQREEQFKPIVEEVKQVKETIDDRQDRLIQKLDENQKARVLKKCEAARQRGVRGTVRGVRGTVRGVRGMRGTQKIKKI